LGRRVSGDGENVANGIVGIGGGIAGRVDYPNQPAKLIVDVLNGRLSQQKLARAQDAQKND
jgi:hypothetical protein